MSRRYELERVTGETEITVVVDLDGSGTAQVDTGIGFLDHMVTTLARHSRIDIEIAARGDTRVDDHHTTEDCAIVLGRALDNALGDRSGIRRFGEAHVALDEALCRVVVDLSGRPWAEVHLDLVRPAIGELATENVTHFFRSLAVEARMALHVDLLRGDNDHHKAEAAFKALAISLRRAVETDTGSIPSTKGVLR